MSDKVIGGFTDRDGDEFRVAVWQSENESVIELKVDNEHVIDIYVDDAEELIRLIRQAIDA